MLRDVQVVYGEKRGAKGSEYKGHADILAPSVAELASLEYTAQVSEMSSQETVLVMSARHWCVDVPCWSMTGPW